MEHAWVGYFVALLLSLIAALLGLVAWFQRQQWTEQKVTNERIWTHLGTKVSDATCQERFKVNQCNIGCLETDFRKHSHTQLPDNAKLIIKE